MCCRCRLADPRYGSSRYGACVFCFEILFCPQTHFQPRDMDLSSTGCLSHAAPHGAIEPLSRQHPEYPLLIMPPLPAFGSGPGAALALRPLRACLRHDPECQISKHFRPPSRQQNTKNRRPMSLYSTGPKTRRYLQSLRAYKPFKRWLVLPEAPHSHAGLALALALAAAPPAAQLPRLKPWATCQPNNRP